MNLYIDVGNTLLKWINSEQLHSNAVGSVDYKSVSLPRLIKLLGLYEFTPSQIYISSVVVNDWTGSLFSQFASLSIPYTVIKPKKHFLGVRVCYDQSSNYGVDRWLTLLSANKYYQSDCVIVDVGSAITVDLIDAKGFHKGGYISPGLGLLFKSLEVCDQLPAIGMGQVNYGNLEFACSTQESIRAGIINMVVSYLNNLALKSSSKNDVRLIITGGDARFLRPFLVGNWVVDELLIFKGINLVAENINMYKNLDKN